MSGFPLAFAARWIGYAVIVLVVLIIATGGFFTVGQNERTVLTTWGALSGVYGPGLHFKIPMVQATHPYEISQKTISNYAPQRNEHGLSTYTVDNQEVFGWLTVFYTLKPSELEYIYTNISRDPDELATRIWSVVVNTYKIEMGKVNTTDVAQKRGEIIKSVKAEVTEAVLSQLHLQIDDVQIPEIEYSPVFNQGVEAAALAKVRIEQALQEKAQAQVDAEKARVNALGTANAIREKADGDAYAVIAAAKAQAESTRLNGEAQAASNLAQGSAQAKVIDAQVAALKANPDYVKLQIARTWDGHLPAWTGGGPIPLLSLGVNDVPQK